MHQSPGESTDHGICGSMALSAASAMKSPGITKTCTWTTLDH